MKSLLGLALMFLLSISAMAETRYVTDVTYVPIRSGPGNQFRILHSSLKSGTQMTVLEAPSDSDWTKVRTKGGTEGWIRTQYLIKTPTARLLLQDSQTQLAQALKQVAELQNQLSALQTEHNTLNNTAVKQANERDQYADELKKLKSLAADAINLNQRYQDLLAKHDLTSTEFDAVRAENDRLKSDKTVSEWLFGAGLVFAGMILMIIMPAFKPKKTNSDWAN